ncbi:cobalamin biosynthesis protein [Pseudomonas capsici]|uniref:Cobalamin biosynthesis protein n=1 Tax=Pseudomonas capsici TaxID=2810614 RepID=A0ABT3BR06_9PSED|nr:cobalamin biosynthesis protein [Pseudomonas capsici]MCV4266619.1 cobalamin biosynthesis protein [Pseudomonas capsici]MCV4276358.1 cobalamin biosynthesis protein [Pseudomonas capsici]MCV4329910.1 cobalamin biosynthesis protein [Pseudomonas capsici]MCV4375238.1 cobalamin biosynthesis protein [Pseudomonas capsici]
MPTSTPDHGIEQSGPALVAGLGCQRGCTAAKLLELIESGLKAHGLEVDAITALASIDLKQDEPGLQELAEKLSVPLIFFSASQMAEYEPQLTHRSPTAFRHTGCLGVAESAALALASQLSKSPATLVIERQKNACATFALASRVDNPLFTHPA